MTTYPVVAMAAALGGWPGGIAAAVLSAFAVHWSFLPLAEAEDWIGLLLFLGGNALTTGIVEMSYHAQTRATKAEAAMKALERSAARDELLSKTATRLLQSRDPQRAVQEVCREVAEFLDCGVFFNFLLDERSERLYLNARQGFSEEEAANLQGGLDCGKALCRCLAGGLGRVAGDNLGPANCPQAELLASLELRSYCCRPLLEQGRVIGTLTFGDRARSGFNPSAIEVMETVSHLTSLALSRSRMETALRESEERFSRFMRNLMGYAWIKDDHGRFVFLNEAYAELMALPLDQLVGKTDEDLFGAEVAALLRENDRRAIESSCGHTAIEHIFDKDGAKRHYLVSKFPILFGPEPKTFVGGVAIDDTQRLQAEERLREVTEQLREADRRKDEFLATLAHELRSPLAPMRSGLDVLRKTGGQGLAADKVQSMMERQVDHLVRLVDDLLEVSRIRRGAIELRKEPLDFANAIENAVETGRQFIDSRSLELRIDLPKEPIWLEADPIRLTQVVANLLNNAAKYTDPGGRIEIRAERRGDEAVLTVADTGVGIPEDMLSRVFDLFAQANGVLGRAQGGLGIGLALVRDIVALHGGSVEAMSDGEGKGSRFVVHLPLVAVEEAAVQVEAEAAALKAPPRALVVDDMRDAADSLALLLSTLGAEVRVAYDGAQALDELAAFRPDVVFLDIGMPGIDGFETARRMRARSEDRKVALVALTGWGEDETRKRVEASDFDRHLVKPARLDELRQALELCDRRSLWVAEGGDFSAA